MDYSMIQKQFDRVLQYSQDIEVNHTADLFKAWEKSKQWFTLVMKSPIYEMDTPVTFELDEAARKAKVDDFLAWVGEVYGNDMLDFFLENYDAILENKLSRPWHGFPSGMKLSKVLMKQFGIGAEDVRQKLSMLIQSNKVTGKLCVSVHPLDFLSASENNHGWRSCHALDGEYRAGNVSYMVDDCTFMVYLKSENDTKLPHFPEDVPWNDKKWRCYFYLDRTNKIVYAARQYPFHSDSALNYVAALLYKFNYFDPEVGIYWKSNMEFQASFRQNTPDPFYRPFRHWGIRGEVNINGFVTYFDNTKVIVGDDANRKIVPITRFITTHQDACCYNDVIESHTYAPYIMSYKHNNECLPARVEQKLVVGGPCKCVTCGKDLFHDSNTFQCFECAPPEEDSPYDGPFGEW